MWMNADSEEAAHGRDHDAVDDQAWNTDDGRTFWRRRFLILCGGVVALGACAWLFPGASQPTAHQVAATRAAMAALAKRQALPPAASGPAWPVPSPSPSPTPSPSLSPSPSPTPTPTATLGGARKPGPESTSRTAACAPGHIVLSLFTGEPSYAKGARPSFSVYAVSTSSAPCTLTYGAGSVQLLVTRHGQVVWDSAACQPAPAKAELFTPGVPQMLTLVWNRAAARPAGCAGSLPAGRSGTLDAVAMSHGQSSSVRTFQVAG